MRQESNFRKILLIYLSRFAHSKMGDRRCSGILKAGNYQVRLLSPLADPNPNLIHPKTSPNHSTNHTTNPNTNPNLDRGDSHPVAFSLPFKATTYRAGCFAQ